MEASQQHGHFINHGRLDRQLACTQYSTRVQGERIMLVMDSATGHKTDEVKDVCKRHDIDITTQWL